MQAVDDGLRRKLGRIDDGFAVLGEAGEETHGPRAQPVGGAQGERRWFTADGVEFPDLVVEIIRLGQPKISRQDEGERVAGTELPFAQTSTLRGEGDKVKGLLKIPIP